VQRRGKALQGLVKRYGAGGGVDQTTPGLRPTPPRAEEGKSAAGVGEALPRWRGLTTPPPAFGRPLLLRGGESAAGDGEEGRGKALQGLVKKRDVCKRDSFPLLG